MGEAGKRQELMTPEAGLGRETDWEREKVWLFQVGKWGWGNFDDATFPSRKGRARECVSTWFA